MQIVFTFDRLNLMHLVLGLFAFWMGLRDLLGKDPLIHTFFNQYDRDPEYRAMWQKKNGVLLMCNAVIFFALLLLIRQLCFTVSSASSGLWQI